jgi:hypothetical protein
MLRSAVDEAGLIARNMCRIVEREFGDSTIDYSNATQEEQESLLTVIGTSVTARLVSNTTMVGDPPSLLRSILAISPTKPAGDNVGPPERRCICESCHEKELYSTNMMGTAASYRCVIADCQRGAVPCKEGRIGPGTNHG